MWDSMELPLLVAAMAAGALLGGLYFGGLWWTVRRMPRARHPLKLYFGSLVVRLAIILGAFYGVLTQIGWAGLLASLAGLVAARLLLVRLCGWIPSDDMPQRGLAR